MAGSLLISADELRSLGIEPVQWAANAAATDWIGRHCDAYHPGSRDECSHCQVMIALYGAMPAPELVIAAERGERRSRSAKARIPDEIRWAVWERDDFTCQHCGARRNLSVDHRLAESKGGTLDMDNLQTLCRPCNSRKGTK